MFLEIFVIGRSRKAQSVRSSVNQMGRSTLWARISSVLLGCMFAAIGSSISAAEIEAKPYEGGRANMLLISGEIEVGDSTKLATALLQIPKIVQIDLNSPGGHVFEAIRMGEIINAVRLPTGVQRLSACMSACFFLWLNGSQRTASSDPKYVGRLGLHRPYLRNPSNTAASLRAQSALQQAVTSYLEGKLVQRRFIDLMMTRSSNMVYWMSDLDLAEIGLNPPELEELYTAKCGGSLRQLQAKGNWAVISGDSRGAEEVNARIAQVIDCATDLDVRAKLDAIEKLRTGWLPPLPFKASR
jgi:hypothetical protein